MDETNYGAMLDDRKRLAEAIEGRRQARSLIEAGM